MMKFLASLGLFAGVIVSDKVHSCEPGLYRATGSSAIVITRPASVLRYTFTDGRRGIVGEQGADVKCVEGQLRLTEGQQAELRAVPLHITQTHFKSHDTTFTGWLIEPPDAGADTPLVVLVHGSERTSPMTGAGPSIFAAFGLRVFAYDKRGTGGSQGEYTQNFELLADDAAAALDEARRLSGGRSGRVGYYGGSQGGWVAPLAATRSAADFVAIGFGLAVSPLEEDFQQVLSELRPLGLEPAGREIAAATSALVNSGFRDGYAALSDVRARYGSKDWFAKIRGEFTGDILATSEADLRRIGRARFDNLELIWNYDGNDTLRRLQVPLLWVLAEDDREAPPEVTMSRLDTLRRASRRIEIFSFPGTDHGMIEFQQAADGTRTYGRITDGYFRLVTDWIKGHLRPPYGSGRRR